MSTWIFLVADAMRNAGTVYLWLYLLRTLRRPVAAEASRALTVVALGLELPEVAP